MSPARMESIGINDKSGNFASLFVSPTYFDKIGNKFYGSFITDFFDQSST